MSIVVFVLLCLRLQPTLAYAIELLYIVLCANLCVAQYTTHISCIDILNSVVVISSATPYTNAYLQIL